MEQKNIKKEEKTEEANATTPKKSFSIAQLLNGEYLQREVFLKYLPFLFFIAFLGAVYIGNSFYAVNKIREINQLENDIRELHSEYISLKSALTDKCKQTQVETLLSSTGVKLSIVPPRVIVVSKEEYEKMH